MKNDRAEGALRPLGFRVPKNKNIWPWLALASYLVAYFYTRCILLDSLPGRGWAMTVFALLFLLGTDLAARAMHRTAAKETPLWAVLWLALSVSLAVWGHQSVLHLWQEAVWHLLAVWFVLARCGLLAQGHTGALAPLDAMAGCLVLPFGNFWARVRTLYSAARQGMRGRIGLKKLLTALATLAVTLGLCLFAGAQLAAADAYFSALVRGFARWWENLFSYRLLSTLLYILLSLPVGAWLFGLVSGAAHREAPPCTAADFYKKLAPFRLLPNLTACIAVGALCALYGLFFALQLAEWSAAVGGAGLSAPEASAFAVDGFWELLRIQMLDLAVLACVRLLGKRPLPKALEAVFCGFGIAFALLAGAKLAVYIRLYAFTPRRVTAGWFLAVLLVWAVLLLVRVFRPIPAAQIGAIVLAVSFVALGCVDVDRCIVDANITRWEQGADAELDTGVLAECGAGIYSYEAEKTPLLVHTARRLADDGWFVGKTLDDLYELYSFSEMSQNLYTLELDGDCTLQLTMQDDVCIAAEVKTA